MLVPIRHRSTYKPSHLRRTTASIVELSLLLRELRRHYAESNTPHGRYLSSAHPSVTPAALIKQPLFPLRRHHYHSRASHSDSPHPSGHFPRLPASYKRGLFSVYQDSTELFQHEQDYENWSSGQPPQLDFSEFLTQDFSHHNDLPGCEYSVSGANFDIDFEALLASTTPSNSDSQTATTTTDSSATLTPVDFSTRQDNAPFDPLNTTSTILFDPSQTQSSHASAGFSLSTDAVNGMRVDIPTNSSFTATTFPSQQSSQQRPTPPPSVSTAERGASKSTSPAAADKTGTVSPSDSHGDDVGPESRKRKRERNTEAARRYRQRRQDRLEELEEALAAMTKDRDDLRIKLARSEAETDILRGLMAKK